jgi:hypothetical protein
VPHLSESIWIGIERWQFVESGVNQFENFLKATVLFGTQGFSRAHANEVFVFPRRAAGRSRARHQMSKMINVL